MYNLYFISAKIQKYYFKGVRTDIKQKNTAAYKNFTKTHNNTTLLSQ